MSKRKSWSKYIGHPLGYLALENAVPVAESRFGDKIYYAFVDGHWVEALWFDSSGMLVHVSPLDEPKLIYQWSPYGDEEARRYPKKHCRYGVECHYLNVHDNPVLYRAYGEHMGKRVWESDPTRVYERAKEWALKWARGFPLPSPMEQLAEQAK